MREKYNGFVKFMCKLDGKDINSKKDFPYKEYWPGDFRLIKFKQLVRVIVNEYEVGDTLEEEDRFLVDTAIVWDTSIIEEELVHLYNGEPITSEVMQVFENWNWRLENGEVPEPEGPYTEAAIPW